MTLQNQIDEIVREIPGLTAAEIRVLLPGTSQGSLASILSQAVAKGKYLRGEKRNPKGYGRGNRSILSTFSVNPDPKPVPVKFARKTPTANGYEANIDELRKQVEQLEHWKAAAIERFPDLAVDPLVLAARKLVAKRVGETDRRLAGEILAGQKDGILPVQIAIEALSQQVAA